jgi:hypothetical protein
MIEALRIIAAVSKKHAGEATKAIRTDSESSRQIMFNTIAESVLADEAIELSNEERRLVSSFITEDNEGGRDYTMRVRLNARERLIIESLASKNNMTVSDLVRQIFLAIGKVDGVDERAELVYTILNNPGELEKLAFMGGG